MTNIINFAVDYWAQIIGVIALIAVIAIFITDYIPQTKSKQIERIKGWLLSAVITAEAELGGGTGKVKLSLVYDMFVERFPWLARVVTFEQFSKYVDDALVEMRHLLATNADIAALVEEDEPTE